MSNKTATAPLLEPEKPTETALVVGPRLDLSVFERLAKDQSVDPDKLEKLINLQERILERDAKMAFTDAFIQMRPEIPVIDERGRILNKQGSVQSTYSKFEDIQHVVLPILFKHGFELSFKTVWPEKNLPRVIGILTHRYGHQRDSEFQASADMSGSKNDVQGLGSTISYGKRYTTIDLLNIECRGVDDDAQRAGQKKAAPDAPKGYQDWLDDLIAASDEGYTAFKKAWNGEPVNAAQVTVFREYLVKTDPAHAERIKIRAQSKRRTS
jgi:hypothetical protein